MATSDRNTQAQIEGLATLLVLNDEIKHLSNLREFGFFATNETHRLITYHTAYLWEKKDLLGVHLVAVSGTPEFDPHSSTNLWLKEKISTILSGEYANQIHEFNASDIETDVADTWPESLPQYFLWCPFSAKDQAPTGGLIFFREDVFAKAEIKMLRWLLTSFEYTWNVLINPKTVARWRILKKKPYFVACVIALVGILLFPVRLSVIGTGTVVAKNPALINAPMQGIIRSFAVTPGSYVKKGQLLLTLDNTDLLAEAKVNQRDYSLTEVKLRTAINEAFNDQQKRTGVPILHAQLAIDKAHMDYTNELLKKTEIRSPIDGVVIFDSTEDWIGQPVQTGERILSVANTHELKLKINLPVTERIQLEVGNSGDFFMTGQLRSIPLKITALGYNAKLTANKILSYEMQADFAKPTDIPQIGAQGTVKLYGNRVPLFYYLIRRPLQSMRHVLGILSMSLEEDKPQQIILPKLRKGITCTFGDYDVHGKPHWMINDASRNKFFIIGWAEYQIFEHWDLGSVDKIIETINNKTTLNIDQTDIESFYTFLKKNYLIQQSGYDIYNLGKEQKLFAKDNWVKWFIEHYLFFRMPLWHPDKFLIRTKYVGSFIFSRYVFYIMIMLGLIAIYQINTQWDVFTHTFSSIFTWNGIVFYFIAFSLCKIFHEMGHAYMCRRYNIPVQSVGIAFLVFWPVLYTDTTLSWVLKSNQRMKIALAGIWIETYVTIIAALIWCNTDSITIKSIFYMIISVNWIASLLINVSPFMRFDGYYVLSDFMRMPNLQPRAFALTRWQIRRWLFDWPDPPPEVYTKNLKRFLIAYSIATWLYRLVLYLGIAVLVYHFFIKIVGILLFIIEIYYFVVAPLIRELQTWYFLKDRFSWNIRTLLTLSGASIAILLLFLPIQSTITLPATLGYFHEFIIAQEGGMLENSLPRVGSAVKKGEVIVQLKSVDLENSLQVILLKYQQKLMELRNAKINLGNFNQKNVILSDINKSQAEYSKLYSLYDKLTIKAPFNGILYEVSSDLTPGVFVMKNEWIADVVDVSKVIVEAYVNESDMSRIKHGLKGYFYPDQLSEKKIPVSLVSIDALNTSQLNCQYSKTIKQGKDQSIVVDTPCYHASEIGGGIATYVTDEGTYVPVRSIYRIKLIPEKTVKINHVERGDVVLHAQSTSYAEQAFYWIKSIFVAQSGF